MGEPEQTTAELGFRQARGEGRVLRWVRGTKKRHSVYLAQSTVIIMWTAHQNNSDN